MEVRQNDALPHVPVWRLNLIRFVFGLMAFVMGSVIWPQILFGSSNWHWGLGMGKSMLAALSLLSLLGMRYPLQMLPLMLYELAWKTIWLACIALPAYASDRMTADIQDLFFDSVGVVIVFVVIPWRYVWARYFKQPTEPWKRQP